MAVDLKKIGTEQRNSNTLDIDVVSTIEILRKINNEDKTIAYAVEKALPQIAPLVDKIVEAFYKDARLIYMGAGTSGRIGVLDASECPPTFGVSYETIQCLIAGGFEAVVKSVEGAEDSLILGIEDLKKINLTKDDIVVGIAASGRTSYVISAIEYAKSIGATTGAIVTSVNSKLASIVDYPIEAITGEEPITGSTRMKSGTAQKMICNMLSTASMIKMGKVYQNLMIDVQMSNEKLVKRAEGILEMALGISNEEAKQALIKYKTVKQALFASLSGIEDLEKIKKHLANNKGHLRNALKEVGK